MLPLYLCIGSDWFPILKQPIFDLSSNIGKNCENMHKSLSQDIVTSRLTYLFLFEKHLVILNVPVGLSSVNVAFASSLTIPPSAHYISLVLMAFMKRHCEATGCIVLHVPTVILCSEGH